MGEVHHLQRSGGDGTVRSGPGEHGPVDLAHEPPITLGRIRVVPSERVLEHNGKTVHLEPKAMQVLITLARVPGEIFSRDDLIDRCWEGRAIGDSSVARIISILRSAIRELGEDDVEIETLPRVGYRLLHDGGELAAPPAADVPANPAKQPWRNSGAILIGVLFLAALAGAFAWWMRPAATEEPLSLVMLPLSHGEDVEPLFTSGFETELRTELARSQALTVKSGDTTARLVQQGTAPVEIGRILKADYVWRGTLSRRDGRVVLDGELTDVGDGRTVWSERIASADGHAGALPLRTARAMLAGIGRPADADLPGDDMADADFDLYLTALGMIRSREPTQMQTALGRLRGVVERNPDFSGGYSALAKAGFLLASRQPENLVAASARARQNALRALELDPQSVEALKTMAMLATTSDERYRYIRRAVELDPGDAEAWLWYSHIAAHPDYAGEEVRAMRQLVAIDPLWGRSSQAAYVAAAEEGPELARSLDRDIIAAAATEQWQRDIAEARIANLDGDVSEFFRLTMRAMPVMENEHRQIAALHLSNLALLLDIDMPAPEMRGAAGIVQQVEAGRLPTSADFAANGLTGRNFWSVTPLVIGAPGQFIAAGRGDELLAIYDSAFSSADELEAFAQGNLRPHHFLPQVGTYIGFAMQQAGRQAEAVELYDLAERSIGRWRANDGMTMTPSLFEANLAAARGQRQRAIDAASRLPQYGYPYVLQSPGVPMTGPLLGDPVWENMRDDPRLKAVLAPIHDNLARERTQVLALMAP